MTKNLKDKLFELAQRWRALSSELKDLDFKQSQWAHDARAVFVNDETFSRWCVDDLGMKTAQVVEMLGRATAFSIVPDKTAWKKIGDWRQIRNVAEEVRDKKQQVEVLEAAKASGKQINAVLKERGFWPKSRPDSANSGGLSPVQPTSSRDVLVNQHGAIKPNTEAADPRSDARILAMFLSANRDKVKIPSHVDRVIKRYVPQS